ncbi:EAL domain-containing response regulator [Arenimonas sp.]|uniref:EAL domain-containing response regulator n=1 Tax=Arenimonas sp. TaxID=1872635 RepID=UPI0025BE3761|nr:EAL domain-containing response regulator [Arenimonas sp.]
MNVASRILAILDDDHAVAETIAVVAENEGFTVHRFAEASGFLAALPGLQPSHVVLDLVMPGMDGVEVLRRLAGSDCGAALLLTSGTGQRVLESARATAAERGLTVVGILPKPFKPVHLREMLAKGVAPRRAPGLRRCHADFAPQELAEAIRDGAIHVFAQPKVEVVSGKVVGAELLARWNHPERGMVPPDVFVALAEASGQVQAFTDAVLAEGLAWFAKSPLREMGSVAVNLSTSSLAEVTLADRIELACARHQLSPTQVVLEITESSAMDRTADCFDTLTRLRLKGFRLSVDDFGTGYSSLAQLARLPLSEIKIDRSFVMQMLVSNDARKIVASTIRLAESMEMDCVAEGVEDAQVLAALAELGCPLAQGYHISRPVPGPEFDAWLLGAR